ncbi:hypothetical protein [Thermococcus sp.]|uniref:hypothetical protein n=1 Tax=Thermococcus sp. TaxID=35749 RepID=UPI00262F73BE|nr:hypothetical protein [Thermococcus sp.]
MRRKRFGGPQKLPVRYSSDDYILLDLRDIDEYKEELISLRNLKQLSPGTFQNKSFAINTFIEYLLRIKGPIADDNPIIKLTAMDVYQVFSEYLKDPRRSKSTHTFRVVVKYTEEALKHILWEKYGISLTRALGDEVFNPNLYLRLVSVIAMRSKAIQLQTHRKREKEKVVSPDQIKLALKWLSVLISERPTITVEKVRLATLIALMTGARGSEINDLQFITSDDTGRRIKQIDLTEGIIYFRRAKLRRDGGGVTPIFIHPILVNELKVFKKKYVLDPTQPIFGFYSIDKIFTHYYTPKETFRSRKKLEEIYHKYPWLKHCSPDKPIITIKLFRKFFDSHLQNMIYSLVDDGRVDFMNFLSGIRLVDELRRYKNYLLGRAEGVDFMHYISLTEDKRFRRRYKRLTRLFVDSIIDEAMPELLLVLSEETSQKFFSKYPYSESRATSIGIGEIT